MSTKNVFKLNDVHDRVVAGTWITYDSYNDSGTLWAWGSNCNSGSYNCGFLGVGDNIHRSSPTQIPGTSWFKLGRGGTVFHAVKSDCTLWGWGYGGVSRLGTNNPGVITCNSPVQIPGNSWCAVTDMVNYSRQGSLALKTDNTLWTWGVNDEGELGDNSASSRQSPVQIPGTGWCKVSFGNRFALALKTNNTLWAWGPNCCGRLGINYNYTPTLSPFNRRSSPVQIPGNSWTDVSAGQLTALALKSDSTLWGWGANYYGNVGDGTVIQRSSPVQIPGTSWNSLSAGYNPKAKKIDGTLWSWGLNSAGQLGDNTLIPRSSPIQIPGSNWSIFTNSSFHTVATKTNGTIWAWGNNNFGQLGDNSNISRSSPIQIPGTNWNDVTFLQNNSTLARKN